MSKRIQKANDSRHRERISEETQTEHGEPDISAPQEPAATPLISAEELDISQYPVVHIPDNRRHAFDEFACRLADSWPSTTKKNHILSKLGEFSVAKYLDIEQSVDVEIYSDGGDGGTDLNYRGGTIDVKTVGRHRSEPNLTVDKGESLDADYYALASRIGESDVRLIGYTPRKFVADASPRSHDNGPYHLVEQRYLFPFPTLRAFLR